MSASSWISCPALPPLRIGHCQVWWATPALARDWHVGVLSADEHERHERLRQPADRHRFALGCALLRVVVGTLTGVAPSEVRLDRSCPDCDRPHGKPVARDAAGLDLDCSVSHSGERIAVAVARGSAIGVDVEQIDPALEVGPLAARVLAPVERASLAQLPAGDRAWGFSTAWTRKEAILKATGEGLRVAPDRVQVASPVEAPRVLEVADLPVAADAITLHELRPGEGYAANLAAIGAALSVSEFDASELLSAAGP